MDAKNCFKGIKTGKTEKIDKQLKKIMVYGQAYLLWKIL